MTTETKRIDAAKIRAEAKRLAFDINPHYYLRQPPVGRPCGCAVGIAALAELGPEMAGLFLTASSCNFAAIAAETGYSAPYLCGLSDGFSHLVNAGPNEGCTGHTDYLLGLDDGRAARAELIARKPPLEA